MLKEDRFISLPNKIKLKKQTLMQMSMDLSLMIHLFGESTYYRFELSKENNAVKLCHTCSKNRINFIFDTSASESITAFHNCKKTH